MTSTPPTCKHCGQPIRDTSAADPSVPYVHQHSHNAKCMVTSTADAVMLQGVQDTEAEPTHPVGGAGG